MSANVIPALPLVGDGAADRDERLRSAVAHDYTFVWRTLCRFGAPEADADDLAQEVFLVFARKLESIEPGMERPFLFRCASNFAMHARRDSQRRRILRDRAALFGSDERVRASAEDDAERQEDLALLDELLSELPDELRAVIVLCELEDMTVNEAAHVLSLKPGTAASRLRRAREALSAAMTRWRKNRR